MSARPHMRTYDSAAFAAIVQAVYTNQTFILEMDTAPAAARIRFQFYSWRKQEQLVSSAYASDIQVRCEGRRVIFSCTGDVALRAALDRAGVPVDPPVVKEGTDLPPAESIAAAVAPEVAPVGRGHMARTISEIYGLTKDEEGGK